MDNTLPSYSDAKVLGYNLWFHSGDKSSATYSNGKLALTVNKDGIATLSAQYKMVELSIKNFRFPNGNFRIFEKQINNIINKVNGE